MVAPSDIPADVDVEAEEVIVVLPVNAVDVGDLLPPRKYAFTSGMRKTVAGDPELERDEDAAVASVTKEEEEEPRTPFPPPSKLWSPELEEWP